MRAIEVGTGRTICEGEELAILTIGHIGNYAIEACEELRKKGLFPAHYDMRFAKPLDKKMLHKIFSRYSKIITVEDGCIIGGMGSAVLEFMADHDYVAQVKRMGMPDRTIDHGSQLELHTECGYHPAGIIEEVIKLLSAKKGLMVS